VIAWFSSTYGSVGSPPPEKPPVKEKGKKRILASGNLFGRVGCSLAITFSFFLLAVGVGSWFNYRTSLPAVPDVVEKTLSGPRIDKMILPPPYRRLDDVVRSAATYTLLGSSPYGTGPAMVAGVLGEVEIRESERAEEIAIDKSSQFKRMIWTIKPKWIWYEPEVGISSSIATIAAVGSSPNGTGPLMAASVFQEFVNDRDREFWIVEGYIASKAELDRIRRERMKRGW
jgi:hypothetical protein